MQSPLERCVIDYQTIWFALWGVLWAVYFMLDGFVLGTGMLQPVLSKNEKERQAMIAIVGPVWNGGYRGESALLASCYQTALQLAADNRIKTIAFPAISTGAYRFPKDLAAMIAINECRRFMRKNAFREKVIFVAYSDDIYQSYLKLID